MSNNGCIDFIYIYSTYDWQFISISVVSVFMEKKKKVFE